MAILDNTLGWYSLSSRTNLYGPGPNFSEVGTPTYSTGKVSSGVVCSSGNYLQISNASAAPYQIGLKDRSYSFWVNMNSITGTTQFFRFGANGPVTTPEGVGLLLGSSGEQLARIKFPGVGWIGFTASGNISTATWYHFVLVVDRDGSMTLYRDGSSVGSVSISSHSALSLDTTDPFYLGGTWSVPLDGTIDEFVVYDGALSTSDISTLYNSGSGISYWSQATAASEVYYDLDDLSDVRGRHWADLTNVGTASFVTGKVGDCVDLDGSTQRLESSNAVFLDMGDEDFGGACWINADAIGSGMGVMGQSNSQYSLQVLASGAVRFRLNTSGGVKTADTSSTMSAGTWYFVNWYHNAATDEIGIQLNRGTAVTAATAAGVPVAGTNAFTIGSIGSGNLFNGKIDQVYFVRGAVPSTSDLDAWYNSGSGAAFSSELELDYAPALSGARKVKIQAKAAQIGGSASQTCRGLLVDESVLVTNISEILDSDGGSSALQAGSDIRFSADVDGASVLPLDIREIALDPTPASAVLRMLTNSGTLDGTSGTNVYLWWFPGSTKAQPPVTNRYGRNSVYTSIQKIALSMDENPAATAPQMIDRTGNGNDFESQGTMTSGDSVAGKIGNAVDFDGTDDRLRKADNATINFSSKLGIGLWFNSNNQTGFRSLITKRQDNLAVDAEYGISYNDDGVDDKFYWYFWNSAAFQSHTVTWSTNFAHSTWTHIFCTMETSGSDVVTRIYKNGSLLDTKTHTSQAVNTNTAFLRIGCTSYSASTVDEEYSGLIDEVWLFNTGIPTGDEITTIYNNQNSPSTFWDSQWSPTDGDGDGMGGAGTDFPLSPSALDSASSIDAGSFSKNLAFALAALDSLTTQDAGALSASKHIAAAAQDSATAMESVVVGAIWQISPTAQDSASTMDDTALSTAVVFGLDPPGMASAVSMESTTLAKLTGLAPGELLSSVTMDTAALAAVFGLSPAEMGSASTIEAVLLSTGAVVVSSAPFVVSAETRVFAPRSDTRIFTAKRDT